MEEELVQIRSSQETQNLVVEKEAMSLGLGSQMEEGEATEEEDVFGRSTVLKNRRDTVVGQETPTQSGGVQESVDMFTDTFLPIETFQSIRQHGRSENPILRLRSF